MSDPFDLSPRLPMPPPPPPPPPTHPFQSPGGFATQQGSSGGVGPTPLGQSSSTSGKARAAMILGLVSIVAFFTFIVPLLAFIFGLIGLGEVRRSHGLKTGRKMAITGIVLGALGIAGFVAVVVVAVNKAIDERITSIADLEVGKCYDVPNARSGQIQISDIDVVDCADGHTGEVFFTGHLDDGPSSGPYPGEAEVRTQASLACVDDPWTDYVGQLYPGEYELFTLFPQELAWKATRGAFACLVIDPDFDELVGSVRGG